ncbi:chorismate-binding protein [Fibrella aquatilis]|uniref:Chorismate-binding protein n=1 Tax=Fibrella aquatilis TaxID=2817059 RepID=A0A939JWC9_9BACT|nr:chorismate-binding protein [Fibrella aquatilis]MBO0929859.1 chorismate-binding protein [Fibrella aquatilis]
MTALSDSLATVRLSSPSLSHIWQTAYETAHPAAMWRLPLQTEKQLIVHLGDTLTEQPTDLDERPPGFAIGLFNSASATHNEASAYYLQADQHYVADAPGTAPGSVQTRHLTHTAVGEAFEQAVWRVMQQDSPASAATSFAEVPDPEAQANFEATVAEAVTEMKAGNFWKVVISRTKTLDFGQQPDVTVLFDRLCAAYPAAFVSAVFLPEGTGGQPAQIWLSATPERLVSVDANGLFKTVALAGTQSAYYPDGTLKRTADALWSQKEIEEQALVSRYIIGCFKKIRLREYHEEGPKTAQAGNLMHLCSQYSVDTRAVNFPQLGTVMLRLLHPTSAVCGMPRPEALAFIQAHERHNRGFYAGFLGPVNIDAASSLFVHIRCLKLAGQTATLYAGAGLTEDSDPQKEWLETEMKCQTLVRGMR